MIGVLGWTALALACRVSRALYLRLREPVPAGERGAEAYLYARGVECLPPAEPGWDDAPNLPIPLLSQDEARRMAEEDTPDA